MILTSARLIQHYMYIKIFQRLLNVIPANLVARYCGDGSPVPSPLMFLSLFVELFCTTLCPALFRLFWLSFWTPLAPFCSWLLFVLLGVRPKVELKIEARYCVLVVGAVVAGLLCSSPSLSSSLFPGAGPRTRGVVFKTLFWELVWPPFSPEFWIPPWGKLGETPGCGSPVRLTFWTGKKSGSVCIAIE